MDRLEGLASQLSQVTMYDIKSMYNQAKNMVLNVSEMEAKVNEATNDDPWGASSTLMQDIAQGTFNFQHFNEIMPCIYTRFMEKEARQWREIYKALQLLEYIIKHGSERVVDDARSHISTIKMLRNFHYIDDTGKDQGINVRNRSKELVDLLTDLDRIRSERRKAKTNKNKYTGVGNDGSSFSASGGRYGGFGNEGYGGDSNYGGSYDPGDRDYSGGGSSSYGNGGGGGSSGGFKDESGRRGFDEYDAGEFETTHRKSSSLSQANITSTTVTPRRAGDPPPTRTMTSPKAGAASAKPAQKVADLLGFVEEDFSAPAPVSAPTHSNALDDDFDDFQSAPATTSVAPALAPVAAAPAPSKQNVFDMLGSAPTNKPLTPVSASKLSSPVIPQQQQRPMFGSPITPQNAQPAFGNFSQATQARPNYMNTGSSFAAPLSSTTTSPPVSKSGFVAPKSAAKPTGNFEDLWSMGLGGAATQKGPSGNSTAGKSIKDLEKEKAQAAIWGSGSQAQSKPNAFGAFGGGFGGAPSTGSGGGGDDLLL